MTLGALFFGGESRGRWAGFEVKRENRSIKNGSCFIAAPNAV
jgi:hypothetical protein